MPVDPAMPVDSAMPVDPAMPVSDASLPVDMVSLALRAFEERVVNEAEARAVLRGEKHWGDLAAATRKAMVELNS
eukprot:7042227-Pyramimonas_sp.AAC.1